MAYVSLETRERRTRRLPKLAALALIAGLLAAYLLVVGLPDGARSSGAEASGWQAADVPAPADPADDGAIPSGVTVFDGTYPAVANIDPQLLGALRNAASDAAATTAVVVTSGWRSPQYQDRLLQDAVAQYGSETEAARWVASAETSTHVRGAAVDVGPAAAIDWLAVNGDWYGLCQVYGNEPWHFEYRPDAVEHGCPPVYADPTWDPRMHSGAS